MVNKTTAKNRMLLTGVATAFTVQCGLHVEGGGGGAAGTTNPAQTEVHAHERQESSELLALQKELARSDARAKLADRAQEKHAAAYPPLTRQEKRARERGAGTMGTMSVIMVLPVHHLMVRCIIMVHH